MSIPERFLGPLPADNDHDGWARYTRQMYELRESTSPDGAAYRSACADARAETVRWARERSAAALADRARRMDTRDRLGIKCGRPVDAGCAWPDCKPGIGRCPTEEARDLFRDFKRDVLHGAKTGAECEAEAIRLGKYWYRERFERLRRSVPWVFDEVIFSP